MGEAAGHDGPSGLGGDAREHSSRRTFPFMSPPTPFATTSTGGKSTGPFDRGLGTHSVIGDSMDLARGLRHRFPALGAVSTRHDRRGQPLLARDEQDGGVRAVVPGGVRLSDRPDDLDAPMLWRLAYWRRTDAFLSDLPPRSSSTRPCATSSGATHLRADWLLTRAARQLGRVASFMSVDVDPPRNRRGARCPLRLSRARGGGGSLPAELWRGCASMHRSSAMRGRSSGGRPSQAFPSCAPQRAAWLRQRRLLGVVRRTRWNGMAAPSC